jgi:hypothetical protein
MSLKLIVYPVTFKEALETLSKEFLKHGHAEGRARKEKICLKR